MSYYKGYDIPTTVRNILPGQKVTAVGWCVRKNGETFQEGTLHGSWDMPAEAHAAGDRAGREWIDQQST